MSTPVIMVHGGFCGGWAFEHFRQPFEAAGYVCQTPDLRGHGHDHDRSQLGGVSMADYARDIADLMRQCQSPPVLVGHSLGGLVSLMAAARAPAKALILLAPSAPWGVAGASLEEAVSAVSLYALGPFWTLPIAPDFGLARRYSVNRVAQAERRAIYARMTSESGRAMWETLNWWLDPFMTTAIQPGAVRAPVLAIAGGADLIHPEATVRQTAAKVNGEVRVFREMSHWLIGEPGWEEVADACLDWLQGV